VAFCSLHVAELQHFRATYWPHLQDRRGRQYVPLKCCCPPPRPQNRPYVQCPYVPDCTVSQQMTLIWTLITANTWNLCIINFQLKSRCWQIFEELCTAFRSLTNPPMTVGFNSSYCPGWRNYRFKFPQNAFMRYGARRCAIWGMKGHAVHRGWFRTVNSTYLFSCAEPTRHIYNVHNGTVLYHPNMFWYYCAILYSSGSF